HLLVGPAHVACTLLVKGVASSPIGADASLPRAAAEVEDGLVGCISLLLRIAARRSVATGRIIDLREDLTEPETVGFAVVGAYQSIQEYGQPVESVLDRFQVRVGDPRDHGEVGDRGVDL